MPKWPITVPQETYEAVATEAGEPYADSYLWGAIQNGQHLVPRAVLCWERLMQRKDVLAALHAIKVTLTKPAPWGSFAGSKRSYAELIDPDELEHRGRKGKRPAYDPW